MYFLAAHCKGIHPEVLKQRFLGGWAEVGRVATYFPNFQWLPSGSSLSGPAGLLLDVIGEKKKGLESTSFSKCQSLNGNWILPHQYCSPDN